MYFFNVSKNKSDLEQCEAVRMAGRAKSNYVRIGDRKVCCNLWSRHLLAEKDEANFFFGIGVEGEVKVLWGTRSMQGHRHFTILEFKSASLNPELAVVTSQERKPAVPRMSRRRRRR